jgi:hypothetical protein
MNLLQPILLALLSGSAMVAWGDNSLSQTSVPTDLPGVAAIASGRNRCLALKPDGTVVAWQAGIVQLQLTGEPGWSYRLEVSTDLKTWTNLDTLTNASGILSYTNAAASDGSRFYRVVVP